MKILIVAIIIILFLLLYSVKIVFSVKLNNFDFSAKVLLKTPFSQELYNNKRKKKKAVSKAAAEEKKKNKITLDKIKELKSPATDVICEVCGIIKKHCRIVKLKTGALAALPDPMENGIAFGIISAVLNIITYVLKEQCNIKSVELEIKSDFDSGDGLVFESSGTLKIRPVVLLFAVLFNRKLIKAIKNISEILKQGGNENG